jgi:cytochrome c oxidase subunit II
MKFIALIVVVLGIIAVAQLMRVYELTSKLRNRREEEIDLRDNKMNANLMLVFMLVMFGSFLYMIARYGNGGNPVAASVEGVAYDQLMGLNMIIIIAVFFITNFLLFYFAFKYYKRPGVKAHWFPHNNKLELLWTVVPSIVLAVIIILGLRNWHERTSPSGEDAIRVELYSKQFDWTVRYAGEDNVLGKFDYKLINGDNPLGLATTSTIAQRVEEIATGIKELEAKINDADAVYSKENFEKMKTDLATKERIYQRLIQLKNLHNDSLDVYAYDDIVKPSNTKLILCKGKEYEFNFRSEDIIHSAFFPHFRAQMNTVPGMVTRLKFTPTITTKEMRQNLNDENFQYILMCNKICGSSHSNMKLFVEVVEEAEYNEWWNAEIAENTFKK